MDQRYFIDTEHVRGEPRIYWVTERLTDKYGLPCFTRQVSEHTKDKRKAERECARLNQQKEAKA